MGRSEVIHIDGRANHADILAFVNEEIARLGRMGRY